jgi:hypothetical protein
VSGGRANGVGEFTYTATATENAGNSATVSDQYRVIYRHDGFMQPINDTVHRTGLATSVFKAGSTLPMMKFLAPFTGRRPSRERPSAGTGLSSTTTGEWR